MPSDSVVFGHIKVEAEQILYTVCNKIFSNKEYNQTLVATFISQTNEESVKQLLNHNKNFKYMVLTTTMQKRGMTQDVLDMSADCYWNSSTDGQTCIRWENDHMYVFISLFACAL